MEKGKGEIIADMHIHSRFSRATSKNLTIPNLVKYGKIKGINLLGTGDFTHPLWLKELKQLKSNGKGVYYHEDFPFIISGEISLIYTQERGRRIHLVILVPSFEIADKINAYLDTKGRRDYDGRPIFKIPGDVFVKDLKEISDDIEIIPAHIWTPWFGMLGSMSGFDSLKECFKEQTDKIYAIETGMSSDPAMNWRLSQLHNKSIISFSDSHSYWPWRMGREATIFSGDADKIAYKDIIKQIRENSFISTIETSPAYGKYHYDGHRLCNFSCSPQETKRLKGICPKCGKPLVIGVENRVEALADSKTKPKNAKPFYTVLPLHELIAMVKETALGSKKSWEVYDALINEFGNEFNILLNAEKQELAKIDDKLADVIMKNREGKINVKPGYDGEYGVATLSEKQTKLI